MSTELTENLEILLACLNGIGCIPSYNYKPEVYANYRFVSSPGLIIPAKNDSVGELFVSDDKEEITVAVGALHHTHFSAYNYDNETSEQRLLAAIKAAAQFVADVLADKVCISVDYDGEECIGSSHRYLTSEGTSSSTVRDPSRWGNRLKSSRCEWYTWSGPIKIN